MLLRLRSLSLVCTPCARALTCAAGGRARGTTSKGRRHGISGIRTTVLPANSGVHCRSRRVLEVLSREPEFGTRIMAVEWAVESVCQSAARNWKKTREEEVSRAWLPHARCVWPSCTWSVRADGMGLWHLSGAEYRLVVGRELACCSRRSGRLIDRVGSHGGSGAHA